MSVTYDNMAPKVAPKLEPGFEMVAGYKRKIPPQNRPVPLPAALGAPMMYQQQVQTTMMVPAPTVDSHGRPPYMRQLDNTSTVNPVAHVTPQLEKSLSVINKNSARRTRQRASTKTRSFPEQPRA